MALEVTKRLELQAEEGYMLGMLVAAALLWSTEAIPLFATSLMIIGAQIILPETPGNWGFINNNSIIGHLVKSVNNDERTNKNKEQERVIFFLLLGLCAIGITLAVRK